MHVRLSHERKINTRMSSSGLAYHAGLIFVEMSYIAAAFKHLQLGKHPPKCLVSSNALASTHVHHISLSEFYHLSSTYLEVQLAWPAVYSLHELSTAFKRVENNKLAGAAPTWRMTWGRPWR